MRVLVRAREVSPGRRLVIGLLVSVAAMVGLVGTSVVGAQSQTPEPIALITAYEIARNRGDLDLAMSYFADDATLTQRTTVYSGRDEIRRYLQAASGRSRYVVVSNRRVAGNQLSWTERPAGQNINGIEVSVQATVQDGKIQSLVYNGLAAPARTDVAADGRGQLPALVGLAAVLVVFSGLITAISMGLPHPPVPRSRLRGRLMEHLQVWRSARTASG